MSLCRFGVPTASRKHIQLELSVIKISKFTLNWLFNIISIKPMRTDYFSIGKTPSCPEFIFAVPVVIHENKVPHPQFESGFGFNGVKLPLFMGGGDLLTRLLPDLVGCNMEMDKSAGVPCLVTFWCSPTNLCVGIIGVVVPYNRDLFIFQLLRRVAPRPAVAQCQNTCPEREISLKMSNKLCDGAVICDK